MVYKFSGSGLESAPQGGQTLQRPWHAPFASVAVRGKPRSLVATSPCEVTSSIPFMADPQELHPLLPQKLTYPETLHKIHFYFILCICLSVFVLLHLSLLHLAFVCLKLDLFLFHLLFHCLSLTFSKIGSLELLLIFGAYRQALIAAVQTAYSSRCPGVLPI